MKVHLIGICGTGMGSLAGLLKAAGHDVRGSDEHVYPPMSTQLAEQEIPVFEGLRRRRTSTGARRGRRRQRLPQGSRRGPGGAGARLPLDSFPALLEELFLRTGARHSVVVAGTHGKTTTSSLLAHVLHGRGARPVVPGRRRAAELPAVLARWARAPSSSSRATSTTPPSSTRDRSSSTTGPQTAHPHHRRVRSRRHLPRRGGGEGRVPQVRRAHPRGRPAGRLRGVAGRDRGGARARAARSMTYGRPGSGADWTFEVAGARARRARPRWRVARRGERVGVVETEPARHLQPREPARRHRRRVEPGRRAAGDRRAAAPLPRRAAPAGGARRRAGRHRRRRLRAPPDRGARDARWRSRGATGRAS